MAEAMQSQKPKVVILGAGPAGISAAWRLTKLGYPVTVLERDGAVGGMGRTIKVGDYSVDFGPHTTDMGFNDTCFWIEVKIPNLFQ